MMGERDTAGFEERIRELAYLLWESSGRQYGRALEYWLAAEREVLRTVERAGERLLGLETAPDREGEAQPETGGTAPAPRPVEDEHQSQE